MFDNLSNNYYNNTVLFYDNYKQRFKFGASQNRTSDTCQRSARILPNRVREATGGFEHCCHIP